MEVAITKMSSKGQIVIPIEMREQLKVGDKIIIIQNGHQLILRKTTNLDKNFEADLKFARRTEEAWKSYEKGEFRELKSEQFLEEIKKW